MCLQVACAILISRRCRGFANPAFLKHTYILVLYRQWPRNTGVWARMSGFSNEHQKLLPWNFQVGSGQRGSSDSAGYPPRMSIPGGKVWLSAYRFEVSSALWSRWCR